MARRLVDLSIPITNDVVTDPEHMRPKVSYSRHKDTIPQMAASFPGLTANDMPDGEGWAVEHVSLSTHNGTHMDGPLEYFLQAGVKLDFRHFPDGYVATGADVEAELLRIGHTLQPLDIVLVNTAAGAADGAADCIHKGCGMGEEATLYLTERGVKVVGTDAWSWDAPFSHTSKRWAETRDPKIIWEGHKAGRFREYYQIEKLTNLEALPANGFTLSCFPVKIAGASAGWIRAVAIFD